jgi:hypothetical protein
MDECRLLPKYAPNLQEKHFLEEMNHALTCLEKRIAGGTPKNTGLIYIVGTPRSGTTLLSQILSKGLKVGYINNLIARFWLTPGIGVRLSQSVLGPDPGEKIDFVSRHGNTFKIEGPHEFGHFWTFWLGLERLATHFPDQGHLKTLDAPGLDSALNTLMASFGRSVVFKNIICGFFAPYLSRINSRSLFVYIHRDCLSVVSSILTCRLERYGSYHAFWSIKPATYAKILEEKQPALQVLSQVLDYRKEVEQILMSPTINSISVSYEDLCQNPALVCQRVAEALADTGGRVELRQTEIPSFKIDPCPVLPEKLIGPAKEALRRSEIK